MPSIAKPRNHAVDPIALDMAGVCDALGFSEGMIRNLMCRTVDPLPSLKAGAARRFPVREVTEWAARQAGRGS